MIDHQFTSLAGPARMKNHFNSFPVGNYVRNKIELSAGSAMIYCLFLQISRLVPVSHHTGGAHLIEFLWRKPDGYRWSYKSLWYVVTHSTNI